MNPTHTTHSHPHPHHDSAKHSKHHADEFDAAHHHHHGAQHSQRRLMWALLITGGFALVELAGGFWSGSLALISDAGHMFTDAGALLLALLANRIGQRPANYDKSYGYARAETIGALVNSITMLGLVTWIFFEAVQRLLHPSVVNGLGVMVIAVIGLGVNIASAWQLSHDHENLNSRAAFVHVLGDLLGSVAAIVAGAVIYFTGWMPIDPILSVFVCLLILRSTWSVLLQAVNVLMDSVPEHLDLHEIGHALASEPGVIEVHDLHIWRIGSERTALTAHLVIHDYSSWPVQLARLNAMLKNRYGIVHSTLQPVWFSKVSGRVIPIHPARH
ncbi:MAG: cation diffusion facilitator family transporter [Formivibrio sp.]|nr:cation diffusion facilitator family transporter [Formivibrio sp.]